MNYTAYKPPEVVAKNLSEPEFKRERCFPDPGDRLYVHLSDLRMFLDRFSNEQFDQLLDYGCGGSPYRTLFKAKNYIRADYVGSENLDCVIAEDGRISLPNNSCDGALSTQVLEHVFSPQAYLSEALRVLRPGGKLILTTHGIWEDHGCPYDFRRWTYDGLRRELEQAGFQVNSVARLTTGPRAIGFLFFDIMPQVRIPRHSLSGLAFRLFRRLTFKRLEWRHKWMDRYFAGHRVVFGSEKGHGLYLALGIEGIKPLTGSHKPSPV